MALPLVDERSRAAAPVRRPRPRRYLMCPPEFFDVVYAINPWMRPQVPVDRARALRQWQGLVATLRSLGHEVEVIDAVSGLPDMVFAANSALVLDGTVLASRFRHRQRRREEAPYRQWLARHGFHDVHIAEHVSEGEGDFAVAGSLLVAGWGIRTVERALREAQEVFGRPVIGLRLVDPRYYHLDTALVVLDDHEIAYYPPAFSPGSRRALVRLFPDAIEADEADAGVLGLNAVSDGYHVVMPAQAPGLAARLRARGFEPVPVDVSEFLKAGGGVKCCALELRGAA
jgi:N-dimethylarginine dimethylaminohydrolase